MSEIRPDYEHEALPALTSRDLLLVLVREVQALRLAVEALRTDVSVLLAEAEAEREPPEPPDPKPLRAGGGFVWPPGASSFAVGGAPPRGRQTAGGPR